MKIYYKSELKQRAKELRKHATFAERLLWKYLKRRQLLGYQFFRQKPINGYIVDFYCSKLHLAIEIDGISHDDKQVYDKNRENRLKSIGIHIVRFDGYTVLKNVNDVLDVLSKKIFEIELQELPDSRY